MDVRVASGVTKRPKTQDLKKLENLKKIPELLGYYGEYPRDHPKDKF